jgi:histidinol-phosphatase
MTLAGPPVDQDLLDFAVALARRAGTLAAERFFAGDAHTTLKPDGTEVTDADRAVEDLIRAELARHAPADEIYGEESGTTPGTSGRRWIIDPIDGTYYFARRIPGFSTLLAFEDEHGPAIGILAEPIGRRTILAGRGRGCWLATGDERTATRVGTRDRIRGARTAMGNPGTWSEELLATLHRQVFLDPTGDTIGLVTSQVDALVIAGVPMGYEDVAPLPVIIGEAGGRVTDLSGNPVLTGDGTVLATNPVLHKAFLALVEGVPTSRDWRSMISG